MPDDGNVEFTALLADKTKEYSSAPQIFNLQKEEERIEFMNLLRDGLINHAVDDYEEQLKEYFFVCNPGLIFSAEKESKFGHYIDNLKKENRGYLAKHGRWIYFPWISTAVHVLEEESFFRVRTARNKNLVTEEEQKKFYNAVVGIAGLSVGNSVALAIALQGGGGRFRLADHDTLALSNTNRIGAGIGSLGLLKTDMTARQIYTLNPYAKIELYKEGLTKKNIRQFFDGPPKIDIVIDEVDNLSVKYLIREQAKRCSVAVIMGADNGDGAVIDIERYDRNQDIEFFHGRLGKVSYEKLSSMNKIEIGETIGRHIGMENVPQRMVESLKEVGKTLVSWPQLGGAAMLNGVAIAFCVREILNNKNVEDNRAMISLKENLSRYE